MINWKSAAKYWYRQFLLWVKAYNQIADIYMIDESFSTGCSHSVIRLTAKPDDEYGIWKSSSGEVGIYYK